MENNVKKRNSILRTVAPEEKTTDNTRMRRRISFNKRKSVREFCASEETKAWNTSYDVSDPKNHSNETVGEKSVHNTRNGCSTSMQSTTTIINDNLTYGQEDDANYLNIDNKTKSSKFANHRDSIVPALRNCSDVVVENSLEVTLTEKERQSRLSTKSYRNNFSFTLNDYEAENLCRTQSLTMEAEKTDIFRHELEERLENQTPEKMQIDVTPCKPKDKRDNKNVVSTDCDMEISVLKATSPCQLASKANSKQSANFHDAMEMMESTPCESKTVNQRTLHFNEDIGVLTPPTSNRPTSSRRTIIFDSENTDDAMNISHNPNKMKTDACMMNEVFTIHKENDMNLTGTPVATNVENVKEKQKLVVKHVVFPTQGYNQKPKDIRDAAELETEKNNQKDTGSKAKIFDKSDMFWNVEDDNKNDSTLFLANVTLDSDPTLSEYMMGSGCGKLNYRQLNDELEKGRIKLFSHTPTPAKKNTRAPLSSALRINLLKTNAEQMSSYERNVDSDEYPRTPLRKGRINQLIQETPHRSLIEFEQIELETDMQQKEIEKSHTIYSTTKNLASRFFDNISLDLSDKEENNVVEQPKLIENLTNQHNNNQAPNIPYDMEHKNPVNEAPSKKKTNRRFTDIAPKDMEIDESHENALNVVEGAKGSLVSEDETKKVSTHAQMMPNKQITNLDPTTQNVNSKTNRLTVSAVHKMILEDCAPIEMDTHCEQPFKKAIDTQMENREQQSKIPQYKLKKSNKRFTVLANETIEIEEDNEKVETQKTEKIEEDNNNMYNKFGSQVENFKLNDENLRIFNKRQTILSNDPIEIEQDNSQNSKKLESREEKSKLTDHVLRSSNKRQTILSNDPIEIEQDNSQNSKKLESREEKSKLTDHGLRSSNKRHTIFSDEPIAIEQDNGIIDIQSDHGEKGAKFKKRHTLHFNEPIDIEQDNSNSYAHMENKLETFMLEVQNVQQSKKRRTVLSNHHIDIEQDNRPINHKLESKEETSNFKGENLRIFNKRHTILSSEPIDIEQDNSEVNEEKSMPKDQNLKIFNKRHTILSDENIEIEPDNRKMIVQMDHKEEKPQSIDIEQENMNIHTRMEPKVVNNKQRPNKRRTVLSNDPMDIEQDDSQVVNKLESKEEETKLKEPSLGILNKLQTTLPKENVYIDQENIQVDVHINYTKKSEVDIKLNARRTVLSHEPIELDQDKNQSYNEMSNKATSQFMLHKRRTVLTNDSIELEQDKSELNGETEYNKENCGLVQELVRKHTVVSNEPIMVEQEKLKSPLKYDLIEEVGDFEEVPLARRCLAEKSITQLLPHSILAEETKLPQEMFEDQHITVTDITREFLRIPKATAVDETTVPIACPRPNISNFLYLTNDTSSLIENVTLALQDSNITDNHNDNATNNDKQKTIVIDVTDDDDEDNEEADDVDDDDDDDVLMQYKTFELPKLVKSIDLETEFAELERLRAKPNISDAFAYDRRISVGLPLNLNDVTVSSPNSTCVEENDWLTSFREKHLALMAKFDEEDKALRKILPKESTIDRLCNLITNKCENWIINKNMQFRKRIVFHHKQLVYASYVLVYEEKNGPCGRIEVVQLKRQQVLCKKNWKPIDYVMDFQLQLDQPSVLLHFYKVNDVPNIVETMCSIDECCTKVKKLAVSMWRIVLMEDARLLRIEQNIYIEKLVHRVTNNMTKEYPQVEIVEYLIELQNLREICFKNIFKPRPHAFREEFQVFHKGLEFLQRFLEDPDKYLK